MCSLCVWGTGNHGELGLGNSIKFSSSPSPIPDIQRYENNTDSSRTHSMGLSMIRIKIKRKWRGKTGRAELVDSKLFSRFLFLSLITLWSVFCCYPYYSHYFEYQE